MRTDHVPEVRHALVDVEHVCTELGIERSKTERGKWTCPRHGGGSLSVRLGPDRTLQARCFGCDFAGDVFTLIAEARGLNGSRDFPEVLAEGARIGGLWSIVAELEDPDRGSREPRQAHSPRPPTPDSPPRPYPPSDELGDLWESCVPVFRDDPVSSYLSGRAISPAKVGALDLARAIPKRTSLPRWATFQGDAPERRTWPALGFRLLVPMFDAAGFMRSVRAWRIVAGEGPKRLPPSGFRASALVLANPEGIAMLKGAAPTRRVVIAEGEPDMLTWATRTRDWAVLGVLSGSWCEEIAARIPDGALVVVATHHDDAGHGYAAKIHQSIAGRCELRRSKE